jgi:hypothetical protein
MSEWVLLICILLILYMLYPSRTEIMIKGRNWSVIEDYDNRGQAAKNLSILHDRMIRLMRTLKHKYQIDYPVEELQVVRTPVSDDARTCIDTLLNNYNPDRFYENDPRVSSETSYTMNKGDSMYICLRDRKNPAILEDIDTVFFVMLHECAHIANYNGWGHDDRFWTVFKFIIHEAVEAGVYEPVDYVKHPKQYCGIEVYYQPLFDKALPEMWV